MYANDFRGSLSSRCRDCHFLPSMVHGIRHEALRCRLWSKWPCCQDADRNPGCYTVCWCFCRNTDESRFSALVVFFLGWGYASPFARCDSCGSIPEARPGGPELTTVDTRHQRALKWLAGWTLWAFGPLPTRTEPGSYQSFLLVHDIAVRSKEKVGRSILSATTLPRHGECGCGGDGAMALGDGCKVNRIGELEKSESLNMPQRG